MSLRATYRSGVAVTPFPAVLPLSERGRASSQVPAAVGVALVAVEAVPGVVLHGAGVVRAELAATDALGLSGDAGLRTGHVRDGTVGGHRGCSGDGERGE